MSEGRKVSRVYGKAREEYDPFFRDLFKSKAKKKKEKQEQSQREANINLTLNQGVKTAAEAEAAKFTALAAKAKAEAAQRLAALTGVQLQGAQATVKLKNVAVTGFVLLVIGVAATVIYVVRESRKSAQLEADRLQAQGNLKATLKQ